MEDLPTSSSASEAPKPSEIPENTRKAAREAHLIPCPYNSEHKIPMDDFNAHIWKCRSEKIQFYPHSLKLKRCSYNMRHFLPEEELPFHELFCKAQTADLRSQLAIEPLQLDVADFLAAQKLRKEFEDDDDSSNSNSSNDDDSEDTRSLSVTSEVAKSDEEEGDDMNETMKRLKYLELKKDDKIN